MARARRRQEVMLRQNREIGMRYLGHWIAGALAGLTLGACAHTPAEPGARDPVEVAALVAMDFIAREPIKMYEVDDVVAPHYAEAATALGAAEFAGRTRYRSLMAAVVARHQRILNEDIPNTRNHVDANVYGIWPLELYRQTGDTAALDYGLALADAQWAEVDADGLTRQARYWIDDVWMIGALQTEAYRATGEAVYIDRAGLMAALYVERLQRPNGLFHHGPDAPFYWGRGNGWVAAGLVEILAAMPKDHPNRPVILEGYVKMMDALLAYQADSGMWRQLIDYPNAWEESSGTAMFGYALREGVRIGILKDPKYREAYERAWIALGERLGRDGRLKDVCVGTGQSSSDHYYIGRSRITGDLHGQAPLLWFANAMMRE